MIKNTPIRIFTEVNTNLLFHMGVYLTNYFTLSVRFIRKMCKYVLTFIRKMCRIYVNFIRKMCKQRAGLWIEMRFNN